MRSPNAGLGRFTATGMPSKSMLERFGTAGVLALIHDAIGHTIGPIHKAIPILERIAEALEDRRDVSDEASSWTGFQTLFKTAPTPFAVMRRDQRLVSFSDSFRRLFERTATQLNALRWNDLVQEQDRERLRAANRSLFRGEVESFIFAGRWVTGREKILLLRATAWGIRSDGGAETGYVAVMHERIESGDEAPKLPTKLRLAPSKNGDRFVRKSRVRRPA